MSDDSGNLSVIETERTRLRRLTAADADFMLNLLNQPSFIQYIGDRGVRTAAAAGQYIEEKFVGSYDRNGYGLYLAELKVTGEPIGICGFVKRDALPQPDLGFALLPEYWSRGYAFETAAALLEYGKETLGFGEVLAITTPGNESSENLLMKLGFKFERLMKLSEDADEVNLFAIHFAGSAPPIS